MAKLVALLRPFAGLALVALTAACQSAVPIGSVPLDYALRACELDMPGLPTPQPGYTMVAPGTIAFTQDAMENVSGGSTVCGAQAVRGATSTIEFSSITSADTILWVATLERPSDASTPDPVSPTMTLERLDPDGPVVVATQTQELPFDYSMAGWYGRNAQPGAYLMRVVSSDGVVLAEGRFDIVN